MFNEATELWKERSEISIGKNIRMKPELDFN
jgi:hypothetical protein